MINLSMTKNFLQKEMVSISILMHQDSYLKIVVSQESLCMGFRVMGDHLSIQSQQMHLLCFQKPDLRSLDWEMS